ncbi:transposase family protein [Rhodococcus pyridinivorans]|uniref:transposase family protein n=1 Tax=Rhodococcus pyridinivorans TaxID=103816 RepID=UPI0039B39114
MPTASTYPARSHFDGYSLLSIGFPFLRCGICGRPRSSRCDLATLTALLPHLNDIVIDAVHLIDATIRITARPQGNEGRCPKCGTVSRRVHSRYRRRPADTAIGAHPVILDLVVREILLPRGQL